MVDFIEVDPSEVPVSEFGRRGNVSEPVLVGFLESNLVLAKLPEGISDNNKSLYSSLSSYVRNHEMPIKVIQRKEDIYLRRLDLDDEGNPQEWTPAPKATNGADEDEGGSEGVEATEAEYETA